MATAVTQSVTSTSAVHAWAADFVTGDIRPYYLFGVEQDNDPVTTEWLLVFGNIDQNGNKSDELTFYVPDCYHYVSGHGQTTVQHYTVPFMTFDFSQTEYIVYSSYKNYPHLREGVASDAEFARYSLFICGLLGCLLLLDGCKIARARLGGGTSG